MAIDFKPRGSSRRFGWIIDGASHGPNPDFDEDLGQYVEAAVIPTLGALSADWLLVVPRSQSLSVADLDRRSRMRLLEIAMTIGARMLERTGAVAVFEHGSRSHGSASGCGVDQAHLHVVGGIPDLLEHAVSSVAEAIWSPTDISDPWSAVPRAAEYLMMRNHAAAVCAVCERPVSQRLRRVVADALGRGSEWDYRSFPHAENARRTKERFRRDFTDAA